MHSGGGEPAAQVVLVREVAHGDDGVGDGGADVGAHNHEHRRVHGELVRAHEGDDDGGGGGRGLHEHGGEDADHDAADGVVHDVEHLGGVLAAEQLEPGAHDGEHEQEHPDAVDDEPEERHLGPVHAGEPVEGIAHGALVHGVERAERGGADELAAELGGDVVRLGLGPLLLLELVADLLVGERVVGMVRVPALSLLRRELRLEVLHVRELGSLESVVIMVLLHEFLCGVIRAERRNVARKRKEREKKEGRDEEERGEEEGREDAPGERNIRTGSASAGSKSRANAPFPCAATVRNF